MSVRLLRTIWLFIAALLWGAAVLFPEVVIAGSCCGGGSAAALMLPKSAQSMVDTSLDLEQYNGYWTKDGAYQKDQPGTDIWQYRLNLGYGLRLAPRWQLSASIPYIWNRNTYSGVSSKSEGMGDSTFNLWYEAYDGIMCRMGGDYSLEDLKPSATYGLSFTVPTGVSPYDSAPSSFDITGRGFYRIDANLLLDKSLFPWSASLFLSYGTHLQRPVNREYGEYVQPYHKKLGDRAAASLAISHVDYIAIRNTRSILTYTGTFSELWEAEGTIDGDRDPASGLKKGSLAATVAWSTLDRAWTVRTTWNHAIMQSGWGSNTVASDIYSLGVNRAFE